MRVSGVFTTELAEVPGEYDAVNAVVVPDHF